MCTVSKIIEYGQNRIPPDSWDIQKFTTFQALISQAEIFDSITNQPDCIEPTKHEWLLELAERFKSEGF